MPSYHYHKKFGKRGSAASHSAYIARTGSFAKKKGIEDLVATGHGNLPTWTEDDPRKLWKAADKFERANGSTYCEYEFALPSELTKEQNLALLRDFIDNEVNGRPYQFALHAPMASIGKVAQPHAHVMVNDRVPDGIERPPEQHFMRFNPVAPELGGCKKIRGGQNRSEIKKTLVAERENWAALQNKHLEENGHAVRVDHRSLRVRGIDRTPERHLGSYAVSQMQEVDRQAFAASRTATTQI